MPAVPGFYIPTAIRWSGYPSIRIKTR
jgi:hypothetical protein